MDHSIAIRSIVVFCALTSNLASSQDLKPALFPSTVPMSVPNFRLSDTRGAAHELYAYAQKSAIVLYIQGNGCPIVRQRYPYMREMRAQYEPKGVKFLYVNSNDLDTSRSVAEETGQFGVEAPVLMDVDQILARTLGLERTAEAILIDPKTWEILYRGMVDDRFDYGIQRPNPKQFYLREALDRFLDTGAPPEIRQRVTKGCLLNLIDLPKNVPFEDVRGILYTRFGPCLGTNSLEETSHEIARDGAESIRSALLLRRCPADSSSRSVHALDFSREEARVILGWFESGMPR